MEGSAEGSARQNGPMLDVRGMPPPENILAVLKSASQLPKDGSMEIAIESNPFQLYDLLQQRGYFLTMTLRPDGAYRGEVRQREVELLKH